MIDKSSILALLIIVTSIVAYKAVEVIGEVKMAEKGYDQVYKEEAREVLWQKRHENNSER